MQEEGSNDSGSGSGGASLFLTIFLSLNIAFLAGTAMWFRIDHASFKSRRYYSGTNPLQHQRKESLREELMWQYSLRSNLLLWGCLLSAYLLHKNEEMFLLGVFCGLSLLNVVTDHYYQYPQAPIFSKVKRGHQIAAIITWIVGVVYFVML